ncbi:hypothetical protein DFH06DRAFT_1207188, partial [Mycena polygramma]
GKMPTILTEMFLKHSAQLPISVCMEMKHYVGEKGDLIISASHRWKCLQVAYGREELHAIGLPQIAAGGLQNLETLYWYKPEGAELDIFLSAPRLHDVTIHVPHISSDIPLIPWGQLTRLDVSYYSPQPCLDIIVHCKNLVSSQLVTKQWLESDSPDTSPVGPSGFLAHLEKLNIEMDIRSTGEHLGPFLRRLKLPALNSLSLSLRVRPGDEEYFISWLTPTLASFLTRSPNLKSLTLDDCVFAEDIADILQCTPNLTRLVLNNSEVDDDFFAVLQNAEHDPVLAPKLEQLELWDAGEYYAEESLTDMIRSRWWSDDELRAMPTPPRATRLKCVKIYNEWTPLYLAPEWTAKLDGYRSQGLQFNENKGACGFFPASMGWNS